MAQLTDYIAAVRSYEREFPVVEVSFAIPRRILFARGAKLERQTIIQNFAPTVTIAAHRHCAFVQSFAFIMDNSAAAPIIVGLALGN